MGFLVSYVYFVLPWQLCWNPEDFLHIYLGLWDLACISFFIALWVVAPVSSLFFLSLFLFSVSPLYYFLKECCNYWNWSFLWFIDFSMIYWLSNEAHISVALQCSWWDSERGFKQVASVGIRTQTSASSLDQLRFNLLAEAGALNPSAK